MTAPIQTPPGPSVRIEAGMAVIRLPMPPAEELHALLHCDPEAGLLFWLPRSRAHFETNRAWRCWNSRYSGTEAFATLGDRYKVGRIYGVRYYAHRVIWRMVTGQVADQIDHINGDKLDNRISNLRNVSNAENGRNQAASNRNRSGRVGVSWTSRERAWRAEICINGSRKHLGYFTSFEKAASARQQAEKQFGFHNNHGRHP